MIYDLNNIARIINDCFMFVTFSKKLKTVVQECSEMILMLSLLLNQNCDLAFLFNFGFYWIVFSTEKFYFPNFNWNKIKFHITFKSKLWFSFPFQLWLLLNSFFNREVLFPKFQLPLSNTRLWLSHLKATSFNDYKYY